MLCALAASSPRVSGILRRSFRRAGRCAARSGGIGIAPPPIPGTDASTHAALTDLFENEELTGVTATAIEVTVSFPNFEDFWLSQIPRYAPTTKLIDAMSSTDRQALKEVVRADLQALPGGLGYRARANAIKGHRRA